MEGNSTKTMNKIQLTLLFSTCILLASCELHPSINEPKGDESSIAFTDKTEVGIYKLKGEAAEDVFLFDTINSQFLTSGSTLKAFYKVLDFPKGLYFSLELSSASLSVGETLSATLETWGLNGICADESISLSVAQVKDGLYYLVDEANSYAYIITK